MLFSRQIKAIKDFYMLTSKQRAYLRSLSQKLEQKMMLIKRLAIAFGNTDEIFAVAMRQNGELNFTYMMGLILSAFSGWVAGTVLGVFASSFLPV